MKLITTVTEWTIFWDDPKQASLLARAMANNLLEHILKPLLPLAGGSFQLNSGARTQEDIQRLIKEGYHPATNSDHLFGNPAPTAGAADVVPACGVDHFFDYIVAHCDRSMGNITLPDKSTISIGQCIREKNKTAWIHLSNPRRMFFPDAAGKTTLLVSNDNGKTYQNA